MRNDAVHGGYLILLILEMTHPIGAAGKYETSSGLKIPCHKILMQIARINCHAK